MLSTRRIPAGVLPLPGVYVEEGPDRDALTLALAAESYIPVYLDPKTVCPCQMLDLPRRVIKLEF